MSPSPGAGIEVDRLRREYRRAGAAPRVAVDDLSFSLSRGGVLGLLGPNGAGKTTTARILTTLLTPTSGRALVAGHDVVREPQRVREACGVSFGGDLGLYLRLSALDNLRFFATMYRMSARETRAASDRLLEEVGLRERARDRVETYSRGMRQRLHLARALLHDPAVVVLDEPSSGLDPAAAREMRGVVARLAASERTVLLTTHDLREAEELCGEVVVLLDGRTVRHASPSALRKEAVSALGTCIEVTAEAPLEPAALGALGTLPGVLRVEPSSSGARVFTTQPRLAAAALLEHPADALDIHISQPSLEDAYLALVRGR